MWIYGHRESWCYPPVLSGVSWLRWSLGHGTLFWLYAGDRPGSIMTLPSPLSDFTYDSRACAHSTVLSLIFTTSLAYKR